MDVGLNFLARHYLPCEGYGRMGLAIIRALDRLGVPVFPGLSSQIEAPAWFQRMQGWDFNRLTLSLMQPYELDGLPGRQFAYTMWETTACPKDWGEQIITTCDRLIVTAPFLAEVFKIAQVDIPIHVVRGGIDPEETPLLPMPCNRPDRVFTFLTLGDRGSRKGWDIAWAAYFKAFGNDPRTRLVIKCRSSGLGFMNTGESNPHLSVWRADIDRLSDIFAPCDCFVFPSRGEGIGLPPREAVAMGVPTIATQWGGMDDADQWAIPLKATLRPAIDMGGLWGEPCVDEVAEKMVWVYEHQTEARNLALKGSAWLKANQTWEHTARGLIDLVQKYGGLSGDVKQ